MTAPLAMFMGALAIVLVHLFARLIERAAPTWAAPAAGPRWLLAGAITAGASAASALVGRPWLAWLSERFDIAEAGPAGAFVALTLSLATMLVLGALLHLLPRALPVGRWGLLFGIGADGSALEAARRPLRWGLFGLTVAGLVLLVLGVSPLPWAAAIVMFVAASLSLSKPLHVAAEAVSLAAAPTPTEDYAALHEALGNPELFEREPAATATTSFIADIVAAALDGTSPRLTAVHAPPGSGKRQAAEQVAARLAERGLATVFVGTQTNLVALATGAHPRLGLLVVDAAAAQSGEALALLRFAIHRLRAREHAAIDVLVLGARPSVVTVARAIGAAEPRVVTPRGALPTKPIVRYLLAAPPDPALAARAPADVHFVALDRPSPLARHPDAKDIAREYLVPVGGPLGRRMREDRAQSLTHARPSRLLVALPGDRDAPERHHGLARQHLRAALAEAPQDVARLRVVFSRALVDHELASLERAGLLTQVSAWQPSATGIVPTPKVMARLSRQLDWDLVPATHLTEPRSGRTREVPLATIDFDYFDGAITTLDTHPGAERFEVRGAHRALVATQLMSATPLRTTTIQLAEAPTKQRVRFRGARELELWEAPIDLHTTHHGVRQYTSEARAITRLLPSPEALVPLRTGARLLVFGVSPSAAVAEFDTAPSASALHAMTHAFREVLPCLFDNAADLGVTYVRADEPALQRPAIVLFDAHPVGLGACADLRDDDIEALVLAALELLTCDCAAHCAKCCESLRCTEAQSLDRREAARILSELVVPNPIPLGVQARTTALRRTA